MEKTKGKLYSPELRGRCGGVKVGTYIREFPSNIKLQQVAPWGPGIVAAGSQQLHPCQNLPGDSCISSSKNL